MSDAVRQRTRKIDVSERPKGHQVGQRQFRSSNETQHERILREFTETQQFEDPFQPHYATGPAGELDIISPPYNFESLLRLPLENNMLRQCIDALVTNVEGHGYRLEFIGEDGQEDGSKATSEKERLENLLDYPNPDQSLSDIRERFRLDLETIGNAYLEAGRDRKQRVNMFAHVPGHTLRATRKDQEPTEVSVLIPRDGKMERQTIQRRFRRYVQLVGTQRIYFKEFGDPRPISPRNGMEDPSLPLEEQATEIIHVAHYCPGSVYGLPRWINQLPAIMGSRQAELTNLAFFKENAIPAMAVLVSGGALTQGTLDDIEEHFMVARGRESMNRILVIEARGDSEAADENGRVPPPNVEMKPLQGERQSDALFQEYDENNQRKVRSAFRLPPLFVGQSEDYSHATARASYDVAEGQVFAPERNRIEDVINTKVFDGHDPQYWAFRSNPPRLSNPETVLEAIGKFDQLGAMTPNIAIGLANELFDLDIPEIEEPWGNYPFSIVKSMASKGRVDGFDEMLKDLEQGLPPGDPNAPQAQGQGGPQNQGPGQDPNQPGPGQPPQGQPAPNNQQSNQQSPTQKAVLDMLRGHVNDIRNAVKQHDAELDTSGYRVRNRAAHAG